MSGVCFNLYLSYISLSCILNVCFVSRPFCAMCEWFKKKSQKCIQAFSFHGMKSLWVNLGEYNVLKCKQIEQYKKPKTPTTVTANWFSGRWLTLTPPTNSAIFKRLPGQTMTWSSDGRVKSWGLYELPMSSSACLGYVNSALHLSSANRAKSKQ